ncbi:ATP-binding protein [Corynebacterium gottingense]|uniref:ATP-binding protein n=1 Tax=Corynebacterium gottingense TaxID=2041036 RepID=A0ABX9UMY8_9CORY|nr:ATP-binding protein [Corynebacterium gottingense]RMD20728.1 ATP-binding protein [Corynebacterium gottingense]WJZ12393.1 Nitrate/nitrite sensor protein NarX [Corynebacterium gottingense]WJZ14712.1 Nitrate/nitrite sensor protein NarX [Corynebacterium gottingense]
MAKSTPYAAQPPVLYSRFTRSRRNLMVAGIASGLARYLGVDERWVRLFFIVGAFVGGAGALAYAALWMTTPLEPKTTDAEPAVTPEIVGHQSWTRVVNLVLVAVAVAGALVSLKVSSGFGSSVVLVLGLFTVGAVLALQAYDREMGTTANVIALSVGALLVMGGVFAIAMLGERAGITGVVVSVLVTVCGVAVLVIPLLMRLTSSLLAEREAKAVADQRAEIAARLHDSVLQTLALIQKQAEHPEEVARLARGQERELRAWLFDAPEHPSTTPASLFQALNRAAGEVEDTFGVVIRPVTVGEDPALTEDNEPVALAAREAMVNAAKHSGAEAIDVYAENLAGQLAVFVRDRGAGFDQRSIPEDRHGVRDSIIGRMERAGGTARITSAPGEGTEVELTL